MKPLSPKRAVTGLFAAILFTTMLHADSPRPAFLTFESPIPWQPLSGRAKNLGFDGTNLLAGLAEDGTRQLYAQQLLPYGSLLGSRIELNSTGSPPAVAFGGAKFLLVWADDASPPSDLYGQFVSPAGAKLGNRFLIEGDANANDSGVLAFNGRDFLCVWEAAPAETNQTASIRARFIGLDGALSGPVLQLSDPQSNSRYPVLTSDRTNQLACWMTESSATGLWQVEGRIVGDDGSLSATFAISDVPARAPYPAGASFGRTNHLVVWSRETGPFVVERYSPYSLDTNAWFPMLFGRLISGAGVPQSPEFQITRALYRQTAPAVGFDGTQYLVTWLDGRYSTISCAFPGQCTMFWSATARRISLAGTPTGPEFEFLRFWSSTNGYPLDRGPSLFTLGDRFAVLVYHPDGVGTLPGILIDRAVTRPGITRFAINESGRFEVTLDGETNGVFTLQRTTDFLNWLPVAFEPGSWRTQVGPGSWTLLDETNQNGGGVFFRASESRIGCIQNLRLLQQVKGGWALDHPGNDNSSPLASDLFGPDKYLAEPVACPAGGTYFLNTPREKVTCAIPGHTL